MFTLLRKPNSAAAHPPAHTPAARAPEPAQQQPAPFDFSRISVTAPLPHLDRIAASFGADHPLSGVHAQVGGNAAEAARSIGARAFTSGENVAFRASPDLRLAAHEAAHVVQQRSGRREDSYERAADAIAERVAAGHSAAHLLPRASHAGNAFVQCKAEWTKAEVTAIQTELARLGLYVLTIDGVIGDGTKAGLVEAFGDSTWESLDAAAVLARLKTAKPAAGGKKGEHRFRWGEMFKDGLLDMTIAVGFDEDSEHTTAYANFVTELTKERKFKAKSSEEADTYYKKAGRAMGKSAHGEFFVREEAIPYTPPAGPKRDITAVVRLVGKNWGKEGAKASGAFEEGMVHSDVAYYSGHGRWGSGPDFDPNFSCDLLGADGKIEQTIAQYLVLEKVMTAEGKIAGRDPWTQFLWRVNNKRINIHESTAANVPINTTNPAPTEFGGKLTYWNLNRGGAKKITGKGERLASSAAAAPERKYRIMVFDGCNSRHYVAPIHATPGFDPKRADILASKRTLMWGDETKTLVQFLDGILSMQNAEEIITNMDKQQREGTGAYGGYGISDNPVAK